MSFWLLEMKSSSSFDAMVELKKILEQHDIMAGDEWSIFTPFLKKCDENNVTLCHRTVFIEKLKEAKIHCMAYDYTPEQSVFYILGVMSSFKLKLI